MSPDATSKAREGNGVGEAGVGYGVTSVAEAADPRISCRVWGSSACACISAQLSFYSTFLPTTPSYTLPPILLLLLSPIFPSLTLTTRHTMSYAGTTPLFAPGPNPRYPALPWRSDHFFAVDDRVRGGTSHSHTSIAQNPPPTRGELIFSGFLDTLTLGGAGFASQSSTSPFPIPLDKSEFQGLRIVVRKEPSWTEPSPPSDIGSTPGGGKGPVRSFVFEIKTEEPGRRPDGRRESVVVWEWSFSIPDGGEGMEPTLNTGLSNEEFWVFDSEWSDFKPTYRGRPVEHAGEFNPAETKEWSFMARSNFQSQSGPFTLQIHSLGALPIEQQLTATESKSFSIPETTSISPAESWVDEKTSPPAPGQGGGIFPSAPTSSAASAPVKGRSGEYYGFALFIFSTVLWIGWIGWALTPDEVLESIGVAWYPNREWAFLIPAWSLFAVLAVYAVFIGLNVRRTPELEDLANVTGKSHSPPHFARARRTVLLTKASLVFLVEQMNFRTSTKSP